MLKRAGTRLNRNRDASEHQPRSEESIRQLALQWDQYVHPRGRDFFVSQEKLIETLCTIGRSISYNDDPILVSLFIFNFLYLREETVVYSGTVLYQRKHPSKPFLKL